MRFARQMGTADLPVAQSLARGIAGAGHRGSAGGIRLGQLARAIGKPELLQRGGERGLYTANSGWPALTCMPVWFA